jgi:hypothetical protein
VLNYQNQKYSNFKCQLLLFSFRILPGNCGFIIENLRNGKLNRPLSGRNRKVISQTYVLEGSIHSIVKELKKMRHFSVRLLLYKS